MRLLIVEDERELAGSISSYLGNQQFSCDVAYDFHDAMDRIQGYEYDCIILDITIPLGSGLNILKELKHRNKTDGVLIISARNSLNDRINGLNLGADDYLTKPFHLPELSARVAAILRRKSPEEKSGIVLGDLTLDLHQKMISTATGGVELTKKEYELLIYFIANKNKVVTKEAIVEHLWGDDIDMSDNYEFIYTHIKNLRKKLMKCGCPDYIQAVYGMGYKFEVPE
ncbi:MAG: response regulator transcription factor [Chitinophagaceae bacterium]|nr:response regulator transcription factor [Chitinophagaceae bacterium]